MFMHKADRTLDIRVTTLARAHRKFIKKETKT